MLNLCCGADMETVGLGTMSAPGKVLLAGITAGSIAASIALWRSENMGARLASILLVALQLGITSVLWRAGIIRDDKQAQQQPAP